MLPPRRTLPEADQQQIQQQQHFHQQQLSDDASQQPFDLTTGFPSIFNDLKLSDRHPLFEHSRQQ